MLKHYILNMVSTLHNDIASILKHANIKHVSDMLKHYKHFNNMLKHVSNELKHVNVFKHISKMVKHDKNVVTIC